MARFVTFSGGAHAEALRLVEGDEHGRVDEAGRVAVGPLGAGAEVVVAPAALGRLVARQAVVLVADQRLDPGPAGLVVGQAAVHPDQGQDPVAVGPDVVDQHGIVAADPRQLAEQEVLAALDRPADRVRPRELGAAVPAAHLDQGRHAERRGGDAEGVMRADARR